MSKSNWNINQIEDLKGKVIIITGATSGLGKEAAKQIALKNAEVIMAVRNTEKATQVKQEIESLYHSANVKIKHLDLASLASIQSFADDIKSTYKQLHILINNAGVMMSPYDTTEDGFEKQMGTNHLGPFALTGQLLPLLMATPMSRIVNTSSIAHRQGNIDFSDINWEKRKYKTSRAYGDSKLANLYFTFDLARKLEHAGNNPIVTAAHPGWTRTELQRHSGLFQFLNNFFSQKVEQGVLPTLRAAFDQEAQTGDYFGPSGFAEMQGSPVKVKANDLSKDLAKAKNLWQLSEKLTQVRYFEASLG